LSPITENLILGATGFKMGLVGASDNVLPNILAEAAKAESANDGMSIKPDAVAAEF